MKNLLIPIFFATMALNACSGAWSENRRAAAYADKIEKSESVTADEYSEMVSFYCSAIDNALDELRPYHEAHSRAIEESDSARIAATANELTDKTEAVSAKRENVRRLGSQLFVHLGDMPDTTRHRLLNYLSGLQTRYSE